VPELPEVETIRSGLATHVPGSAIEGVEVHAPQVLRRQDGGPGALGDLVVGRTITGAHRRGKFLWLTLAGEDYALLIHLGMSGQVLVRAREREPHRHLRVRLALRRQDGSAQDLWFVDQRMFGYLAAVPLGPDPHGGGPIPVTMTHIGPDPFEPALVPGSPLRRRINRRIRASTRGIKAILLDQQVVSGVGNIYADEALWRARVHGARPANRLTAGKVEEILTAATDVMVEALAAGGTSFDALYVDVAGEPGYFERALAAYGRAGQPCLRCGALIVRETYLGRSSFRCPRCQRRPARTR